MTDHFADQILARAKATSPLVVGIDPDFDQMPTFLRPTDSDPVTIRSALTTFCRLVLEASGEMVCGVKFQSAFFEQFGTVGLLALADVMALARTMQLPLILDVKRGDIGSTSLAYARGYLAGGGSLGGGRMGSSDLGADCITVNPFMGEDAIEPFLRLAIDHGKGVFFLVKTSNPGSGLFMGAKTGRSETVADRIARLVNDWAKKTMGKSGYGLAGGVVGATFPEEAERLRKLMPRAIILAPGVGFQGGGIETMRAFFDNDKSGALVPMSRTLTYPEHSGNTHDTFQKAVQEATQRYVTLFRERFRALPPGAVSGHSPGQ
ncbi:MAG: orotidine-5'-phosphate decarboxylase [Magnetococcales bacterium]|nr:orotidine-5'-phosphate decarboxylase [Magnetococcales bacterium]